MSVYSIPNIRLLEQPKITYTITEDSENNKATINITVDNNCKIRVNDATLTPVNLPKTFQFDVTKSSKYTFSFYIYLIIYGSICTLEISDTFRGAVLSNESSDTTIYFINLMKCRIENAEPTSTQTDVSIVELNVPTTTQPRNLFITTNNIFSNRFFYPGSIVINDKSLRMYISSNPYIYDVINNELYTSGSVLDDTLNLWMCFSSAFTFKFVKFLPFVISNGEFTNFLEVSQKDPPLPFLIEFYDNGESATHEILEKTDSNGNVIYTFGNTQHTKRVTLKYETNKYNTFIIQPLFESTSSKMFLFDLAKVEQLEEGENITTLVELYYDAPNQKIEIHYTQTSEIDVVPAPLYSNSVLILALTNHNTVTLYTDGILRYQRYNPDIFSYSVDFSSSLKLQTGFGCNSNYDSTVSYLGTFNFIAAGVSNASENLCKMITTIVYRLTDKEPTE